MTIIDFVNNGDPDESNLKLISRINELTAENNDLRKELLAFKTEKLNYRHTRQQYPLVEEAWMKFQVLYNLTKENK